ncbi:MAG: toxin-antitoxin system YwqK family antitoxin [Flavobacteriales bacterium]|nr:toxin-antitoxin system YwqK family antitoxin [Flavobacteriales bacterium]MCB9193949.1 toxin-antitoxin system YwqK family antitoxin [Flavobacteriales bacterium]
MPYALAFMNKAAPMRIRQLLHLAPLLLFIAQPTLGQADAGPAAQDTLNRVDEQGRKQGYWQITAPVADKPGYANGQVVEEGRYVNSRRAGEWRRYWPNGKLMSEINYQMGRPRGDYHTYYPDGTPEEQGSWDLDRNTGRFRRWHPNGQLAQDFVFDQYGVRNGMQKYYYENGQLAVEVNIKDGQEEGNLKRYYANGDPQQVAQFQNGVIDADNSKYLKPVSKDAATPKPAMASAPEISKEERTNAVLFKENGYNTLYDKQLRISQSGEFKNGRLWNGRYFRYDSNGHLTRIEIYLQGRYTGDGVITDEDQP